MFSRKELNLICVSAHSTPGCVIDIFANKSPNHRKQIPALTEFYNLLQTLAIDEECSYRECLPHLESYNQGIYFHNNYIIGCIDIEPNTLQYVTFWTTNTLRESKHFTACSGSFMFVFNIVENTILPHIYSYFVIDKSTADIVPILSLDYLEDNREGLDFVDDAMNFLKNNFDIPIKDTSSFNSFVAN